MHEVKKKIRHTFSSRRFFLIPVFFGVICFIGLGLKNIGIGEAPPAMTQVRYPPSELISSRIWAKPLETFHQHLKTRPAAARAELQAVAKRVFQGHQLTEEWVPLYFRVSQHGTAHASDLERVSELEIRMLMALDAQKHALQIQQHQHAMKELKAAGDFSGFFESLSPKSVEALKSAKVKETETLDRRLQEATKKNEKVQREAARKRVAHLRTLTVAEQRDYLLKREAWHASRPARKQLEIKFPGSINSLWNEELQRLIDAGYTLPEGVEFR